MARTGFRAIRLLVAAGPLVFGLAASDAANAQVGYECILDSEDGGFTQTDNDFDANANAFNNATNLACGSTAMAGADGSNTAVGSSAMAGIGAGVENQNAAFGGNSQAGVGTGSQRNTATGQNSAAGVGVNSDENASLGAGSRAGVGDGSSFNTAVGEDADAGVGTGSSNNTALGNGSDAGVGDGISDATALGGGASANFSGSTALGAGSTAMRANQMVYGTATETHTMPGITSDASRSFQDGPLEIVTTDAMGNLASDQGNTFRRIRDNKHDIEDNMEGIAMALSLQDPDLTGDERLGLKVGWGTFSGENAMGVTVAGVVLPDIGAGIRLGLAGGASFGLDKGNIGGRAGVQLSW